MVISCTNHEDRIAQKIDPDAIYFDYKIFGEEEKGQMAVLLQYKAGDNNGKNLQLKEGSSVALDGEKLEADSAGFTGAYYEARYLIEDFIGPHTITFTNGAKTYTEEFEFNPFALADSLPQALSRDNLEIQLEGLDEEEEVLIVLTDTAFHTNDINRKDSIKNGLLKITKADLQEIKNGPVTLEIYRLQSRPIEKGTKVGGRLSIEYGVRRIFELNGM